MEGLDFVMLMKFSGQITRPQLMDIVTTVFPKYDRLKYISYFPYFSRCEADVVINNIFKVFDIGSSGKVVPQELLLAFSMSMKGSGAS